MPRVVRKRRIPAPAGAIWSVVADPYHLPRWWPRTRRVENVSPGEPHGRKWTQVLETRDGRGIRADYRCVSAAPNERYVFEQELEGTPFAGILRSARTEIELAPEGEQTRVTMASEQRLRGLSRLGSPMMRRAIGRTLSEALAGLERATGSEAPEAAS
ncbi:MAG: SRPBCC family protein [Solirubrobacterales bacterium]